MRVTISGRNFELGDGIVQHVERRIARSLGTASDHIHAVAVRLSDRGDSTRCQVVVWLRPLRTVIVEAIDRARGAAVDQAVRRATRAVGQHLRGPLRLPRRERADRFAGRLLA